MHTHIHTYITYIHIYITLHTYIHKRPDRLMKRRAPKKPPRKKRCKCRKVFRYFTKNSHNRDLKPKPASNSLRSLLFWPYVPLTFMSKLVGDLNKWEVFPGKYTIISIQFYVRSENIHCFHNSEIQSTVYVYDH